MRSGGRYYIVDGKRVPEHEYEKARQASKQQPDQGKTETKTQRGKQS